MGELKHSRRRGREGGEGRGGEGGVRGGEGGGEEELTSSSEHDQLAQAGHGSAGVEVSLGNAAAIVRQLAPDVRAHAEAVCLVAELDLLKPHKAVTGFDLWVQLYLKVCLLIAIVCMQLYVYGKGKGRHTDMLLMGISSHFSITTQRNRMRFGMNIAPHSGCLGLVLRLCSS